MSNPSKSSVAENGSVRPGASAVRPSNAPHATSVRGVSAAGDEYELECVGQFLIDGDGSVWQFPANLRVPRAKVQKSCVLVTGGVVTDSDPKVYAYLSISRDEDKAVPPTELCRWFSAPTGMLFPVSLLPGEGTYVLSARTLSSDHADGRHTNRTGGPVGDPQSAKINIGDGPDEPA